MRVIVESGQIGSIPVLTMAEERVVNRPAVVFICGYGGSKEDGLSLGYRLAREGFFFIGFDPFLHGERYGRRLDHASDPDLGGIYPPETGLDTGVVFHEVIQRCLTDVEVLLAHYAEDERVDSAHAGVTGLSMGGYATFLVFGRLPQIKAAVPMIGLPSFTRRWQDLLYETAHSNPDWGGALTRIRGETAMRTAFVRQIDPLEDLSTAPPRALLIMNCDFDTDQPKLYSIEAYRQLRPAYGACPDNLALRIYPAGHTVTDEMESDAVSWFVKHLLGQAC